MGNDLSKEKIELFNLVIQNLSTAMKNSVLYSSSHPIFKISIKNFKDSMDKWFASEKDLDLGISTDTILLAGSFVDKKSELYRDVAEYLHSREVVAICFKKGVEVQELLSVFNFLTKDVKSIREKGGIDVKMPKMEHIDIKGVDYSSLLEGSGGELNIEEEKIWQSLSEISSESKEGKLPGSKKEFIVDFLKDTKRSSLVLNKVYKDAVIKLEDEKTVKRMRESIARVYEYFAKNPGEDAVVARGNIGKLISRLDPDLVIRLFDPDVVDGRNFDMAQEMMKDFSDEFVAEFIENLISHQDRFNENLLKVFDKIIPGGTRANNVAAMVSDRMEDKNLLSYDTLNNMQMSIKEIFGAHPDSNFMSQMYKLTVETFVDRKKGVMMFSRRLVPLVEEYIRAVRKESLKKQEAELLLNIIWHEDDPEVFKKFSEKFIAIVPDLLSLGDTELLRQAFELFSEDMRPEQKKKTKINDEAARALLSIEKSILDAKIVSLIESAEMKNLEDIVAILNRAKSNAAKVILDEFVTEPNMSSRNKLGFVLAGMQERSADEIVSRISEASPTMTGELFSVLRKASYEKSRLVVPELLRHADPRIREQVVESFVPVSGAEKQILNLILWREKDKRVRRKALISALKTGDTVLINSIFRDAERRFFDKKPLLEVVKLSGEVGRKEAVPNLVKVFMRKGIFGNSQALRLAALVSMGRLRNEEAMKAVRSGKTDKSESIRNMCEVILKLDKGIQQNPAENPSGGVDENKG
jgi:hypothetical protein